MDKLPLLRDNDKRGLSDLEWITEFYEFLQGNLPEKIRIKSGHKPKLNEKKAFSIIWYLQEHMAIIPDNIERCDECGILYNADASGYYSEKTVKHYCDSCCPEIDE